MTGPLIVASSRTGNTMKVAAAVARALPGSSVVRPPLRAEDLAERDAVILAFWCDKGKAPEEIREAAAMVSGKTVGCLATMGGDPGSERGKRWFEKTCRKLASLGSGNTLAAAFCCRGKVEPGVFEAALRTMSPEAAARHRAARTEGDRHPDEADIRNAVKIFTEAFGSGGS